jgi:hypothetical protein
MKIKRTIQSKFAFFLLLCIGVTYILNGSTTESIVLRLERDRTSGSSQNPQYIRGTFTIHANGPDDLVWIAVFFNESIQHNVTGNSLEFKFNTQFYPEGDYIIVAVGQNANGENITSSAMTLHFKQESSGPIWYILGALGLGLICILLYQQKIAKNRNKKPSKSDIQIQQI